MTEPAIPEFCSYATFGEQFFRLAVTEERVLGALAGIRNDFEFGPIGVGPGKVAKVTATGSIGEPTLTAVDASHVAFRLAIPVDVRMVVDLGIDQHRFRAAVTVNLDLTARAALPLAVFIDVDPPTKNSVEVSIQAESMRASLLRVVADVDGELQRFVAKYVAREIDKPALRKARTIDIERRMNKAWSAAPEGVQIGLTKSKPRADG